MSNYSQYSEKYGKKKTLKIDNFLEEIQGERQEEEIGEKNQVNIDNFLEIMEKERAEEEVKSNAEKDGTAIYEGYKTKLCSQ